MDDIHNSVDKRNIEIQNVGINNFKLPFCF
ncbi:MAG: GTP cyclohydrolase I FolE2 [Firmicutes bacterium]|nr:GTP cyclohydrolase I FolE2 [Bacillota bacterium]